MINDFLWGFWPWYISGPVIGFVVFLLFYTINERLGLSGSLDYFSACIIPEPLKIRRYLDPARIGGLFSWKLFFAIGVVGGGVLAQYSNKLAERFTDFNFTAPTWQFDSLGSILGGGPEVGLAILGAYLFFGGILIGFGTRFSQGCTSGHGILGMAQMAKASVIATVTFFASGTVMTWILKWVTGS